MKKMATSIRKTIHYKRAVLTGGEDLQATLTAVFNPASQGHKVGSRKEIINADSQSFRVVNRATTYNGMLFGQMIMFEPGRSQAYVEMNDEASSYTLDALTNDALNKIDNGEGDATAKATAKKKHKKEFIDAMLYFGVFENHVVLIQSQSLKSRELEAHLGSLIGRFGGLKPGTALILQDQPSQAAINKIERSPVKSIHLGSPVETHTTTEDGSIETTDWQPEASTQARKLKFMPSGIGANVLVAALGESWFQKLKLEDDLDEANLQVSLEVTYLRKTTKTGQRVLDSIATSLRHLDDADVKIELVGGGQLHGGDLKLSGPITVSKLENGLYDEGVLYHAMHAWLATKLLSGDADSAIGPEE